MGDIVGFGVLETTFLHLGIAGRMADVTFILFEEVSEDG
jgi:hypothetical protein